MAAQRYNIDIAINAKARRAKQEVEKLSGSFDKLKGILGKVGLGYGVAEVTQRLYELGKVVAKTGAEAEAAARKFDLVFGAAASDAHSWVERMSSTFGIASHNLNRLASSLQDTFVPLGSTREQASLLSKAAVELAINLSRFEGMRVADVVNDIRSAMIGNWETTKKYGSILTDTIIKERAREWGLKNITVQLDQELAAMIRLHKMMEDTADANQDLEGSMNLLSTRLNVMQNSFEDSAATLGQEFAPEIKHLADTMTFLTRRFTNGIVNIRDYNEKVRENTHIISESGRINTKYTTTVGLMRLAAEGAGRAFSLMGEQVRKQERESLEMEKKDADNRVRSMEAMAEKVRLGEKTLEQYNELLLSLYKGNEAEEENAQLAKDKLYYQEAIKLGAMPLIDAENEQYEAAKKIAEQKRKQEKYQRSLTRLAGMYKREVEDVQSSYEDVLEIINRINGITEDTAEYLAEEEVDAREELVKLRKEEAELAEEERDAAKEKAEMAKDYAQYSSDQEAKDRKKLERVQKELQELRTREDIQFRLIKIQAKERELAELRAELEAKTNRNLSDRKQRMEERDADNKKSIADKKEELSLAIQEQEERLRIIDTERERMNLSEEQLKVAHERASLSDIEKQVADAIERQDELLQKGVEITKEASEQASKLLSIDKERLETYKKINAEKQKELYLNTGAPMMPQEVSAGGEEVREPNSRLSSVVGPGKPAPKVATPKKSTLGKGGSKSTIPFVNTLRNLPIPDIEFSLF